MFENSKNKNLIPNNTLESLNNQGNENRFDGNSDMQNALMNSIHGIEKKNVTPITRADIDHLERSTFAV